MKVAKATFDTVSWGFIAGDLKLALESFSRDRKKAIRVGCSIEDSTDLQAHKTLLAHTLSELLRRIVAVAFLTPDLLMPLIGEKVKNKTVGLSMAECAALHLIRDSGMQQPFSSLIRIATDAMMRH